METTESKQKKLTSSWIACCTKGFPVSAYKSTPSSESEYDDKKKYHSGDSPESETAQRKPGGWKAISFVLGNETFERLASIGLLANFMVFLLTQFHMDQVMASNVLSIWSGITNFAPLVGAYLSDSYLGRFKTIAYASFGSLMGMLTLTLVAWIPQLHPPPCKAPQGHDCKGPTTSQLAVLAMGLGFLSIGGGGIRPGETVVKKLLLTNKFRFLNKAAIIMEGELQADGSNSKPWRLCSIQQIEEFKCLLKTIPVWASGIICFTAMAQQGTFTVSQASKMDRHLGPHFQIPVGSLAVISMVTIGLWLPLYDRVIVPPLRKVTKVEGGITLLQRMGIGIGFSILSMVAAGLVEIKRRASALEHAGPDGIAPISVMWLAPQLILMGFAEAFNIIGQIEFYNKEFPENMSSVANSLFSCTAAGASYLSALLVNVVHKVTRGKNGQPDWLTKDINAGKVENFYFLIAGLGVLNFVYFVIVSRRYQYKTKIWIDEEEKPGFDVELNVVKQ
ncbi:Protein NRT1/PTR FAMILY 2.13 [Abeliophyllum distichum]|uniref:Protein NRT1/PTR FAMILY 2.13 n=1 Tax=Abeliophyllum distichum TaxID=126358 RepID=A0ABD1U3A7_9LAMI